MLVSLIDTLDIRAILLSNHYSPKLSSNFNYRKKILTTQKLYNYTFLVPLSHPVAYFGPLLRGNYPSVITAFWFHAQFEGHQELHNNVESQRPAKYPVGFEPTISQY